jgi:Mce-associated membrane protein
MSSTEKPTPEADDAVDSSLETIEVDLEIAEIDPGPAVGAAPASPVQRVVTWCRARPVAVLAVALLLASAIAAGSVYWWLYRPDRLTDAAAQQQAVAAAKEGTEALLSYSPENLDKDLSTAKSHLTEPFLGQYTDFTDKTVVPAARDRGVKTEANVAEAAVSQIRPGRAEVLVFVNQVTTSKSRPTPALATSSVLVTLVQTGGRWLISEFAPI